MSFFNNQTIQNFYSRYYGKGQIGQLARINQFPVFDIAPIGIGLTFTPGDTVTLDINNQWVEPPGGDEDLATHVIGFETTNLSKVNPTPTLNQNTFIEFEDSTVPLVRGYNEGVLFVQLGESIVNGNQLIYDRLNKAYITRPAAFPLSYRLSIIAKQGGNAGDIIPVKVLQVF